MIQIRREERREDKKRRELLLQEINPPHCNKEALWSTSPLHCRDNQVGK